MIDVARAKTELQSKTRAQIDATTADTWASRALAATELALEATTIQEQVKWLMDAREYEHEAGEHASGAGVKKLQEVLDAIREHKLALRNPKQEQADSEEMMETTEVADVEGEG